MPVAVNYTELAPSVSNVKYRTEPKPEGLKYIVDATAHFTNVYSIALDPQGMDLHAEIVYLGVPILAAVAYNPALTKKNAIMVHFESFAENSKQLMQLVGDIAAGETVKVTVRNVLVTGKSYGWIQDMLKGLAFTVDIPKIPKGVQEAVQESVEAAKAIKWMQDAISAIGIHIMLTP